MTKKPFRFAVQGTRATSAREWYDLARRAEDLGYSTLFVADHYLGPGPAARACSLPPQHLAPIAAMAAAAAVTSTLRIGCRVFCIDYHLPAVLVKEATTVDLLSDGRLEMGIGAGLQVNEYKALGIPFQPGKVRVDKLEEVIALLKAHWSGEPIDVRGDHVTVSGYKGLPLPVQRPRPPLMIGGNGGRILSLAAREAEIVSISNVPFDPVNAAGLTPRQEAVRRYEVVRGAAGDRLAEIEIEGSPYFTILTEDPAAAYSDIANWISVDADVLPEHPNVLVGTLDEMEQRLQANRAEFGTSYVTVPQNAMETFVPLVERLRGR
ncbi:TIGR03621 family F420-dependent LLM class oxidoreductase [Frankia sp. CNm7]|uniref:TIGR03621 family F420-dependent LLM class oxidoreductase n=1 Tax=Frankia nepalensis TaxID=1836974 RepID=A0A937UN12_9ACTN|nr:TIGR03621 family F420-dependent LLM class oxidoreductase [Frankia nepalensis]MBL7502450.1 TIGR03621 family F420-dependent LLM class oxidoreductase [Frankia nepalensis]MBL7516330.1 TIGR03621 family F420-dependent LLM class oxidoreductase [Frankia nepalensis]MBL7519644.1 TIGR03621 family F420-dependent LLM class oxidoreductase [Frankia nepalensis]MBL7625770.1 TIGR03621 family F420-dependent LLM class oxidoreductase [Frankia nepalensis]